MSRAPYPGGSYGGGAGTGGGGSAGLSKSFPAGLIGVKVRRGNIVKGRNGCCGAYLSLMTGAATFDLNIGDNFLLFAGSGIGIAAPVTAAGDPTAQLLVNGPGRVIGVKLDANVAIQLGDGTSAAVALNVVIDGGTPIPVAGTVTFGGAGAGTCVYVPVRNAPIPDGCHTLEIALNANAADTVASLQATVFATNAL